MEGLTQMPINWETLLKRSTPENAILMLREELGPRIIEIMEIIASNLEERRFLSVR